MTSNIPEKDLEPPFDLYVHAAKKDYDSEINSSEIVNAATNNYITCTSYENVRVSKKSQKASNLTSYIKINGETKQFLAKLIGGVLSSAKNLYDIGTSFICQIEEVRLSEMEDKYIRDTNRSEKEYHEERSYRLNLARIHAFAQICNEQLSDTICSFVLKVIRNINIPRSSTLAGARMNLDDADKSEDKEAKLTQKLKSAMENAVYSRSEIYRSVVINTVIYFMKCLAFIVNKFIWHNHKTQNPGMPTLVGLFATHGLDTSFIKEYVKPADAPKPAKKTSAKPKSGANTVTPAVVDAADAVPAAVDATTPTPAVAAVTSPAT